MGILVLGLTSIASGRIVYFGPFTHRNFYSVASCGSGSLLSHGETTINLLSVGSKSTEVTVTLQNEQLEQMMPSTEAGLTGWATYNASQPSWRKDAYMPNGSRTLPTVSMGGTTEPELKSFKYGVSCAWLKSGLGGSDRSGCNFSDNTGHMQTATTSNLDFTKTQPGPLSYTYSLKIEIKDDQASLTGNLNGTAWLSGCTNVNFNIENVPLSNGHAF